MKYKVQKATGVCFPRGFVSPILDGFYSHRKTWLLISSSFLFPLHYLFTSIELDTNFPFSSSIHVLTHSGSIMLSIIIEVKFRLESETDESFLLDCNSQEPCLTKIYDVLLYDSMIIYTCCIVHTGLEPEILQLSLPSSWNYRFVPLCPTIERFKLFFFFFFFVGETVAWTRMFYYLSHTSSSPFSSGYFGNEVL
jgi:hypothetical protein